MQQDTHLHVWSYQRVCTVLACVWFSTKHLTTIRVSLGEKIEYDALGVYILSHRSTSLRFFMVPFLKVNRGEFIFLPVSLLLGMLYAHPSSQEIGTVPIAK